MILIVGGGGVVERLEHLAKMFLTKWCRQVTTSIINFRPYECVIFFLILNYLIDTNFMLTILPSPTVFGLTL